MTLRIECPSCKQAFEVSEELKGRTVECGSCEKRFQVSEQVVVSRPEKYFPDELKKKTDLSRFGRAPVSAAPVEFRTAQYQDPPRNLQVGPVPLARNIGAMVGFILLALLILLFYFGTEDKIGAILADIEIPKRMLLGGFLGLISAGLILWGMVRNRALGALFGIGGLGAILALAWFRPVPRTPKLDPNVAVREIEIEADEEMAPPLVPSDIDLENHELTIEEVMELIRWPASVQPIIVESGEESVAVVWLKNMEERSKFQVGNFLQQAFGLEDRPEYFSRAKGGIFLLTGSEFDLDEVAGITSRLGEIDEVFPELRVVSVTLNPAVISEPDLSTVRKLEDPNAEEFYTLNYNDLGHLDRERVRKAVGRLARAQPVRLRDDIKRRLVALLGENLDAEFSGEVAEALKIWSEPGDGADEIVADVGNSLKMEGKDIPAGIISFLVFRKTPTAIPLLVSLWEKDTSYYQSALEEFGPEIETSLWEYLSSSELQIVRSAVSILGRVGTKESIPYLQETATQVTEPETKAAIEQASSSIMNR